MLTCCRIQNLVPRAGLRRQRGSGSAAKATDYLAGSALDEAEAAGEDLEIVWPLVYANDPYADPADNGAGHNGAQNDDADMIDASRISAISKGKARQLDGCKDWKALEAIL